jgi:hypothetical protein
MGTLADRIASGGRETRSILQEGMDRIVGGIDKEKSRRTQAEDKAFARDMLLRKEARDAAESAARIEQAQESIVSSKSRTSQSQVRLGMEREQLDMEKELHPIKTKTAEVLRTTAEIENEIKMKGYVTNVLEPTAKTITRLNEAVKTGDKGAVQHRDMSVINSIKNPKFRQMFGLSPAYFPMAEVTPQDYANSSEAEKQAFFDGLVFLEGEVKKETDRRQQEALELQFKADKESARGKVLGEYEGISQAQEKGYTANMPISSSGKLRQAKLLGKAIIADLQGSSLSKREMKQLNLDEEDFANYADSPTFQAEHQVTQDVLRTLFAKKGDREFTFRDADGEEITYQMTNDDKKNAKLLLNIVNAMEIPEHSPYFRVLSVAYDDITTMGTALKAGNEGSYVREFQKAATEKLKEDSRLSGEISTLPGG